MSTVGSKMPPSVFIINVHPHAPDFVQRYLAVRTLPLQSSKKILRAMRAIGVPEANRGLRC